MRHIRFLAVHSHFNEDVQKQLVSGNTCTFSSNGTKITVTPTSGTICSMPVWELTAECPGKDVERLITVILPSMAAAGSSLSHSCKVTCGLIANTQRLEDGTYLHTADGSWARYDQADSLLAGLDAVTEVFEVPRNDPRRQHSNISNQLLSSVAAIASSSCGNKSQAPMLSRGSSKSSSSAAGSRDNVVASDQQRSEQQQEEIFRGLRARCNIPANVPITQYNGLIVTSLDPVTHSVAGSNNAAAADGYGAGDGSDQQAADTAYFQRYLLGPAKYFQSTSVYNYGNPMSKGPMINDAAGTGKAMNCGMGCLLRKKGKAVSLQDVVLTVRPIAAKEELLTAYKMNAAAASQGGPTEGEGAAAPVGEVTSE